MRLADTGRAVHPKLRASSLRHFTLDDSVMGGTVDAARGAVASLVGAGTLPVIHSPTGRGRRFSVANATGLSEAAADTESRNVMEGDWTEHLLVRLLSVPGGSSYVLTYSGNQGDAPADPQNYMGSALVIPDRRPSMFWEFGAGTNVQVTAATYDLPLNRWVLLTWRKSNTTGPGDLGGTCRIELFVNGHRVPIALGTGTSGADFQTVTNTSNGSAARWCIGHERDVGGNPIGFFPGDIDSACVYAGVLTEEEIWEDVRRLYLQPFFTRTDVRFDLETQTPNVLADLTNENGVDWLDTADVTLEVDQPCNTARVTLLREVGDLTLSILRTDSKFNLTDPLNPASYSPRILEGRRCEVWGARVPLGIRAAGDDWVSVLKGNVDDVDEGGAETVSLAIRDEGGVLVDTFIEETVTYGDVPPVAVEGEMQFILNDNDNDVGNNSVVGLVARTGSYAPITLYTPTSPGWAVTLWKQRREGVLPSLRTLAAQIAWECRYRFDPNPDVNAWRLTFFDPDRLREDVDMVLLPDDVLEVPRFNRSILGVRNVVRVIYPSSETTTPVIPAGLAAQIAAQGFIVRSGWNSIDGQGNRVTAYVEIESPASIALIGRRLFMEMGEAATSQVDTIAEAATMAFGALLDLQESPLEKGIRMPLAFEFEVNDMVKIAPTILSTAAQRLALRSVTHTFSDQATTTMQLRGKPCVGFKRWLRLEARPGQARPGVQRPSDANADVYQGSLLTVMRNLVDRTNAFRGGKFLQLRNPDFQGFTNGRQNPPDSWTPRTSTWLTDIVVETVNSLTGNLGVRFTTINGKLESDPVPISGDFNTPYSFEVVWQRTAIGTNFIQLLVEFLDASLAVVGTYTLTQAAVFPAFGATPNLASTWFKSRADGVRPPVGSGARFLRVVVQSSGVFVPLVIDSVSAYFTGRELNVSQFHQTPYAFGAGAGFWYPIPFLETVITYPTLAGGRERYDWGNNLFVTRAVGTAPGANNATVWLTGEVLGNSFGDGYYVREDGTYQITAVVLIQANTASRTSTVRLVRNATYSAANNNNTGGTVLQQSTVLTVQPRGNFSNAFFSAAYKNHGALFLMRGEFQLLRGDRVTLEFFRSNTDVDWAAFASGSGLNQFSVKQKLSE